MPKRGSGGSSGSKFRISSHQVASETITRLLLPNVIWVKSFCCVEKNRRRRSLSNGFEQQAYHNWCEKPPDGTSVIRHSQVSAPRPENSCCQIQTDQHVWQLEQHWNIWSSLDFGAMSNPRTDHSISVHPAEFSGGLSEVSVVIVLSSGLLTRIIWFQYRRHSGIKSNSSDLISCNCEHNGPTWIH